MRQNKTKAKITAGEVAFGAFVGIPSPAVVELLAYAGLDFVIIDAEHAPMDVGVIDNMVRAADAADITPLVRIPRVDSAEIVRLLDLGVLGVQVPMVQRADDIRAAVAAVKYWPDGSRRMGFARASRYPPAGAARMDYLRQANSETMVICQIETAEAVRNIDEIVTVDGVDVFFVGPADLSASLGYPEQRSHPVVRTAIDTVLASIRAAGKTSGSVASDLDEFLRQGVRYVCKLDAACLLDGATRFVADGRAAVGRIAASG